MIIAAQKTYQISSQVAIQMDACAIEMRNDQTNNHLDKLLEKWKKTNLPMDYEKKTCASKRKKSSQQQFPICLFICMHKV